jgi:Avidin family
MNEKISFSAVLGVALLSACASIEAKPPTCTQPVGKWQDQLQSVLEIKTYDTSTGAISGQYISHSGAGSWPMVGWINSAAVGSGDSCRGCKGDHAVVITFTVRWTKPNDSVTTWSGTCAVNSRSGREQIFASWHTTRSNSGFDWDHTLTGAEPFVPIE